MKAILKVIGWFCIFIGVLYFFIDLFVKTRFGVDRGECALLISVGLVYLKLAED